MSGKEPKVAFGQRQQPNVALNAQGNAAAPQTMNPGEECMKKLAEVASANTKLKIAWASQADSGRMLRGGAIHPLQTLENIHQHKVRMAGRGADLKTRMEKEQAALTEFFIDDSSEPRLLTPGQDNQKSPLIDPQLSDAEKTLSRVDSVLSKLAKDANKVDASKLSAVKNKLKEVVDALEKVRTSFPTEAPPLLKDAKDKLNNVKTEIDGAKDWKALQKLSKERVGAAAQSLGIAMSGLSRVQMFYDIDAFYLFRLLVRYKVESDKRISEDDRKKASSELTGTLNNKNAFLIAFLKEKLVELAEALKGDDVFFHLKGGRALAYLLRAPELGENDWDTSIVINPTLPAADWYKKYYEVHDIVLRLLKGYKRQFFKLIHDNYQPFMASLNNALPQLNDKAIDEQKEEPGDEEEDFDNPFDLSDLDDQEPDESLFAKESANCKAELIDIGIPRRDTVEALDQWLHTRGRIIREKWTDDIPIPSHLYYIDEYVMMVREALTGTSQSAGKTAKRIRRLYDMLNLQVPNDKLDDNIKAERKHIPEILVPDSIKFIESKDRPYKNLLTVMLKQFTDAYEIEHQGEKFAKNLDAKFAAPTPADRSADLKESINKDGDNFKKAHDDLLNFIAGSTNLAAQLAAHAKKRAELFGFGVDASEEQIKRRRKLTAFVRDLYGRSLLTQKEGEELEVQLAVTGSYAAFLHADYRDLSTIRSREFEPVTTIDLKFICYDPKADPKQVYKALIEAPLNDALKALANNKPFTRVDKEDGRVLLYWPEEVLIDGLTYAPLSLRITVQSGGTWPQLAFIWGLPVLSLRDLIREYDRRAAEVEELGAKQTLRSTSTFLKEILTEYDNAPARVLSVTK